MRSILLAYATASLRHTPISEIEDLQHYGETPTAISAWTVASDHLVTRVYVFGSCSKESQLPRARNAARVLQKTIQSQKRYSKLETAFLTKNYTMSSIEKLVISSIKASDASAEESYSRMRLTSRLISTLSLLKMKN